MHDQDALVRLQLGKRLEQVLLDKEEAYQELDSFKVIIFINAYHLSLKYLRIS